jgi:inorganic pyrophosphatase
MGYWESLDKLVSESQVVVDRPANTSHPKFPDIVYPYDYGYLEGTSGGDGEGIDVWLKGNSKFVAGVIATVDLFKKDAEVKLLIGFSEDEMLELEQFHNVNSQSAKLVVRPPSSKE